MRVASRVSFVAALPFAVLVLACSGTRYMQQYVVRDPSPGAKSVTVLPSTLAQADRAAADYLAGLLIECGVPVIARPSIVDTCVAIDGESSSSSVAQVGSALGLALSASGRRTSLFRGVDPLDAVDSCRSDMVAITRPVAADNLWIQLMSRETHRLLFSGMFSTPDSVATSSKGCLTGYVARKASITLLCGINGWLGKSCLAAGAATD
jgi:hypothetical protein